MRRLGRALDRDPMRLYRFAASKDELLDGIVELVLSELEVSDRRPGGRWPDVLRTARTLPRAGAGATRTSCRCWSPARWPPRWGCGRSAPCAPWRPCSTCSSARASTPATPCTPTGLYIGFLQGHVLNELQERVQNPDETDDLLRLGLHRLPAREFPRLRVARHRARLLRRRRRARRRPRHRPRRTPAPSRHSSTEPDADPSPINNAD